MHLLVCELRRHYTTFRKQKLLLSSGKRFGSELLYSSGNEGVYLKKAAVFLRNVVCCVEYFYDSGKKKVVVTAAGIIHAQ